MFISQLKFIIIFISIYSFLLIASAKDTAGIINFAIIKKHKLVMKNNYFTVEVAPDKVKTPRMSLIAKKATSKPAPDKVNTRPMALIAKKATSKPAPDKVNTRPMALIVK